MDPEQSVTVMEAVATMVQALAWPLLVLFLILYFRSPLKKFLEEISKVSIGASSIGLEVTAERQIEAAASLGAAIAKKAELPDGKADVSADVNERQVARTISAAVTPRRLRRLSGAFVLWVDDNPSNNIYERKALEALGIRFTLSTSTEDALRQIKLSKYDVIISDMGRGPDKQAGYHLLEDKQKLGDETPFIIYAGSNLPEQRADARKRGAYGSTNDPQELFELVTRAIESGDSR